jgi:hypothetical protein
LQEAESSFDAALLGISSYQLLLGKSSGIEHVGTYDVARPPLAFVLGAFPIDPRVAFIRRSTLAGLASLEG